MKINDHLSVNHYYYFYLKMPLKYNKWLFSLIEILTIKTYSPTIVLFDKIVKVQLGLGDISDILDVLQLASCGI